MTYNNSHPLANPFNSRMFSNNGMNPRLYSSSCIDKSTLTVPNQDVPMFGTPEWDALYNKQKNLTVPNQDVPLGDQLRGNGFINDNLFRLSDGSIVDFKKRQIVFQPKQDNSSWGTRIIRHESDIGSWNDPSEISLDDLINNDEKYKNTAMPNGSLMVGEPIDPKSAAYWLKASEEAEKLIDNMTDEQKKLISDFESHFPKSRLIEESLKGNNQLT